MTDFESIVTGTRKSLIIAKKKDRATTLDESTMVDSSLDVRMVAR